MAIAFVDALATDFGSADPTINKPAGLANGQLAILFVSTDSDHTKDGDPSGFTYVGSVTDGSTDSTMSLWYKYITNAGGEPAWSPSFTGTENGIGVVLLYSGVDQSVPIDGTPQMTAGSSSTATPLSASITPTVDNCMLVAGYGCDPSAIYNGAAGGTGVTWGERVDQNHGTTNTTYVFAQDGLQGAAAAAQAQPTFSNADVYNRFITALNPSTGVASQTPRRMLMGV